MSRWLSFNEACRYLGVGRTSLYRLCDDGRVTVHRLQGFRGLRFREEDLDRLHIPSGTHSKRSPAPARPADDGKPSTVRRRLTKELVI